jgi:hypothetical protein
MSSADPEIVQAPFPFNAICPPLLLRDGQPTIYTNRLRYFWWKWLTQGWSNNIHFSEFKLGDWNPYNRRLREIWHAKNQGRLLQYWLQDKERSLSRATNEEERQYFKKEIRRLKKKIARRRHKTKRAWRRGRKPRSARRLNKK